jgi:hypothetical protein
MSRIVIVKVKFSLCLFSCQFHAYPTLSLVEDRGDPMNTRVVVPQIWPGRYGKEKNIALPGIEV